MACGIAAAKLPCRDVLGIGRNVVLEVRYVALRDSDARLHGPTVLPANYSMLRKRPMSYTPISRTWPTYDCVELRITLSFS